MTRADAGHDAADRATTDPFRPARRSPWPRLHAGIVVAVFAGGCAGGLVRYVVSTDWPTPTHVFPWPTFTVNVAGAFVLGVLVVLAGDVFGPSTYLRPVLGTGFCGALTTFSSVVVAVDQLVAHGHALLAVTYLLATIVVGLAAGLSGLAVGRWFAERRRRNASQGGR